MVQGASRGIGRAFVRQLLNRGDCVTATARRPPDDEPDARWLRLDLEDESSIEAAAEAVESPIDLLINVAGLLHDGELQPEKKLGHCDPEHLVRSYRVNAIGPLLVAKHFERHLADDAVFASLSARVGSIDDNRLGGWYAYRAAKAAQNMFTRNLAIEWGRVRPKRKVVALHPGTVATDLSAPFRRHAKTVFEPDVAARQLLEVIDGLGDDASGGFFAWDGSEIRF
jgi:NAD(P)-dependent dehydrogenase (short-subunit alcohol dehydrogenase family)